MKDKLSKLIDVKSIVTILLTGVFGYLSIRGEVTPDQFLTVSRCLTLLTSAPRPKNGRRGRP